MTKNYIKYCVIFLFVILISSCEGYLEEELYGDMAANTFPTEETVETLLNAAYERAATSCLSQKSYYWATEYSTPAIMYRFRNGGSRGNYDRWDWANNPAYMSTIFDNKFYAIRSCNDAITLVPELENMKDSKRKVEIVAEARFLRAVMYFNLVRLAGGMPIITEPQTLSDNLYPGRASNAETYAFIIEDLKAAAAVLPSRSEFIERGLLGHATKEAAKGVLAKVYITMAGAALSDDSYLSEAKTLLDEIIASGEHGLLSDYSAVFDWKDDNNKEFLFAWQCEGDNQSFNGIHWCIPKAGSYLWMPEGREGPTYDLIEPEYALYYMEHDTGPRFQFSVVTEYYEKDGTYHHFLGGPEEAAYVGKHRWADASCLGCPNNIPVLRYSDVLLLHSEVINELEGPTSEAYAGINLVRERAELDPLSSDLSKEEFREKIFIERDLEFLFEQNRLFDIRRRGYEYAKELMENYYNPTQNRYNEWTITVEEREMLFPFPQSYLDANPNLTQNPGY